MGRAWRAGLLVLGGCTSSSAAPPEPASLAPESFLLPETYDCRAGAVTPPERPHAADCFRDASCTSPLLAGHRMATPFAPENSLSALRAAILLGLDIVETDVRLTADGHIVLIHDGEVDRTLDGTGDVADLTLAEIQAMPMKTTGKPAGDFSCDRVPTLEEALALAEGKIVVELEVKDTAAGVAAAEYLRDHVRYGDSFMLCSAGECDALRAAVPDVPIMSRPELASEVAAEIDYDPPPILVHVDYIESFLVPEIVEAIHGVGAKIYANAFVVADFEAVAEERYEAYGEMFDGGLEVVQTELPHLALFGIGRLEPR